MKKLIALILLSLTYWNAFSCTTFFINKDGVLVFGKNYDFVIGYGMVNVNKRGIAKQVFTSKSDPYAWTSKFGSVTFNQFGREFPSGGINEAGLVIELMWLDDTRYPAQDERAAMGSLQWIQYQLDNSQTVEDIIASDKNIRITPQSAPLHFLVADQRGTAGSIEFIDGKLVYHSRENMPASVLTNDTYEKSIDYAKQFSVLGGDKEHYESKTSLSRFVQTCRLVKEYNPNQHPDAVRYSFDALDKVSQGTFTRWNIVYDIKEMSVSFRTSVSREIKNIKLNELDFSCSTPSLAADIDTKQSGDISNKLERFSSEDNKSLIYRSYSEVDFLRDVPDIYKDQTALFGENLICGNEEKGGIIPNTPGSGNNIFIYALLAAGLLIICSLSCAFIKAGKIKVRV